MVHFDLLEDVNGEAQEFLESMGSSKKFHSQQQYAVGYIVPLSGADSAGFTGDIGYREWIELYNQEIVCAILPAFPGNVSIVLGKAGKQLKELNNGMSLLYKFRKATPLEIIRHRILCHST